MTAPVGVLIRGGDGDDDDEGNEELFCVGLGWRGDAASAGACVAGGWRRRQEPVPVHFAWASAKHPRCPQRHQALGKAWKLF